MLRSFSADHDAVVNSSPTNSKNGWSTEYNSVTVISSARVPLVKWRYEDRVDVDITFAQVSSPQPPSTAQLLSIRFLQQVSIKTRPNVYGLRTCLQLRELLQCYCIPFPQFSLALRLVKKWASKRCIYNNLFTYPNGVVLSIMMTKASLQLALRLTSSCSPSFFAILCEFFSFFSSVLSETSLPIPPIFVTKTLFPPAATPRTIPGLPPCWTPCSISQNEDLFPVINPAFPYANSARFVGRAGLKYLAEEVQRAHDHFQQCRSNESRANHDCCLSFLFQPFSFPRRFSFFASVHFCCRGPTATFSSGQIDWFFQKWKGYLQSKIRIFIYTLECFLDVRPYPHLLTSSDCFFSAEKRQLCSFSENVDGYIVEKPCAIKASHGNIISTDGWFGSSQVFSCSDDYVTKEGSVWIGISMKSVVKMERIELSAVLAKAFHYFDASWRSGCVSSILDPNGCWRTFPEILSPSDVKQLGSPFARYKNVMIEPWYALRTREEASKFLPISQS